jgi:hypothetical protein
MLTKAEIRKKCGKLKQITEEERLEIIAQEKKMLEITEEEKENWREYLSIIKEIVEDCIQEALE